MNLTSRNTHRDIAYFFVGLIISFALSGIFLNHRRSFNPNRYTYEKKEISITLPAKDSINDSFAEKFKKAQGFDDNLRRINVDENRLTMSFESHDVKIDLASGKGTVEAYRKTPLIAQLTQLHKDTSNWWIYYSDAFGIGMIIIAITGMFIEKGKSSFKSRGWKLALVGIIFPLIFLFLLS